MRTIWLCRIGEHGRDGRGGERRRRRAGPVDQMDQSQGPFRRLHACVPIVRTIYDSAPRNESQSGEKMMNTRASNSDTLVEVGSYGRRRGRLSLVAGLAHSCGVARRMASISGIRSRIRIADTL
uniref:Uncharacterized protein n=1 Tax=Plectus sambesii TaxID=2011161 RepID=A0A914VIL2_9BILA